MYPKVLDRKTLINTCSCIGYRLELKSQVVDRLDRLLIYLSVGQVVDLDL